MSAKDGKDCKHDIEADKEPTGFICKMCIQKFEEDELVILTKEQHQLYVDLKEAVGIALKSYHTPGDDAYSDEMISLKEALEALEGG